MAPATDSAPDDPARELAALFPAATEVLVAGRLVSIPPCTLMLAGNLLSLGWPLVATLPPDADAFSLLDSHPREVAALIVRALGVEREWVEPLDVADRAKIVAAWVRVNGAFFWARLVPAWLDLHQAVAAARGDGPTSSSPSTAPESPTRARSPSTPPTRSSAPRAAASVVSAASA